MIQRTLAVTIVLGALIVSPAAAQTSAALPSLADLQKLTFAEGPPPRAMRACLKGGKKYHRERALEKQ